MDQIEREVELSIHLPWGPRVITLTIFSFRAWLALLIILLVIAALFIVRFEPQFSAEVRQLIAQTMATLGEK